MCHCILTILPPTAKVGAIEALYIQHERNFKLDGSPDKRITPWIEQGELCYWTTGGVCDCGTALLAYDADSYDRHNSDDKLAKRVEKLRKQGWSQHKTDNWLSQKVGTRERKHEGKENEKDKAIGRWHSLLSEILKQRLSSYVCLLVLWDDKDTVLKGRVKKKLSSDFAPLEDNTIYMFS
jgi:hypothetical protein